MSDDPIKLAILARVFRAIAEEMGINLVRSAFSTVVREARDCSTALLDAQGRVIAQAEMIPIQTAALGQSFQRASAQLDLSAVSHGHAVILNDPYSGGQHLNDIILFQPIMLDGVLIGWAGNTAHHLDIGGGSAGVNVNATELVQEGMIIPPILFEVERDWNGGFLERLIFANIRTAEIGLGDINAQFAANHLGRERMLEVVRREGIEAVRAGMDASLDYSERRMRAGIAALPDGRWSGEACIDGDIDDATPVRVAATVTISGETMTVDFTGSAPQTKGIFNATAASATAGVLTALRSVLTDYDIPANDGCNRPLTIVLPEGSVVNPRKGAPVRARLCATLRVLDAVHDALAKAVPDSVPAQGANTTTALYISMPRANGTVSVYGDILGGGFGAGRNYDGAHALDHILSSCRNTPVESIEQVEPHLFMRSYALVPDSCGAGQFRGGVGFTREIELLEDGAFVSFYSDHFKLPPRGVAGGGDAACGSLTVTRGAQTFALPVTGRMDLIAGDVVKVTVCGGAGWGPPEARDPSRIQQDVEDGLITPAFAERKYGWRGRGAP